MSDTPRMDELTKRGIFGPMIEAIAEEGRKLERDLARVTAELEALNAEKGIEPTPEKCLSCEYQKCGICRRCIDFDQWEAKRELPKFKEPGR